MRFKQWDDSLDVKQALYIVDACFSGLAGTYDSKASKRNLRLSQVAQPSRQILTAGQTDEVTLASSRYNGSLFTTAVIDALGGSGDLSGGFSRDGIISASELKLAVQDRINAEIVANPDLRRFKLTPTLKDLVPGRGDFFFLSDTEEAEKAVIVASKEEIEVKDDSKDPNSHFHAANQYSKALTHSHPGGSVPHPHNYVQQKQVAPKLAVSNATRPVKRQPFEPEMVIIPAGTFTMGCLPGRDDTVGRCNYDVVGPVQKNIQIASFLMAKTEVTFAQWDACTAEGKCIKAADADWGRGNRPVINVSWDDIQSYLKWLKIKTGKNYQLPSEAQWEYAARANRNTAFPWGNSISCIDGAYGSFSGECKIDRTRPVASYAPNAFGLYDTSGNVREWTQDCWSNTLAGVSQRGLARTACQKNDLDLRVQRGGSWFFDGEDSRSEFRYYDHRSSGFEFLGFRLALIN